MACRPRSTGVFEANDSEARLGLSPFSGQPLLRRSDAEDARLSGSANGAYAGWQWSYTGELAYNDSRTETDRAIGGLAYTDETKAITKSAQSDIVLNRGLWRLPAGQVSSTLTARASYTELDSDALRAGVTQSSQLSRSIGQLQAQFRRPADPRRRGSGASASASSRAMSISGSSSSPTSTASPPWAEASTGRRQSR
jgi:hypothetical protein